MVWWRPPRSNDSFRRYETLRATRPHGRCAKAHRCVEHDQNPTRAACSQFPCDREYVRASDVQVGDTIDTAPGRTSFGFGTVISRYNSHWGGAERVNFELDHPGYGTSYGCRAVWDLVVRKRPCPHGCK